MHELHLAEDVLRKLIEKASEKGLKKVAFAKVAIGRSRVSDEAEMIELFAMVAKDTIAEGAKLEVEIVPMKAVCTDCKTEFDAKIPRLDCSNCGSTNIQISSGKELLIESVV